MLVRVSRGDADMNVELVVNVEGKIDKRWQMGGLPGAGITTVIPSPPVAPTHTTAGGTQ